MENYSLSFSESIKHTPKFPDRTAKRACNWNYQYQVWSNRKAMAKSIRMQQKRAYRQDDWQACVSLTDGEGY